MPALSTQDLLRYDFTSDWYPRYVHFCVVCNEATILSYVSTLHALHDKHAEINKASLLKSVSVSSAQNRDDSSRSYRYRERPAEMISVVSARLSYSLRWETQRGEKNGDRISWNDDALTIAGIFSQRVVKPGDPRLSQYNVTRALVTKLRARAV